MASLMASTCRSLKVRAKLQPRCPEVPNDTRSALTDGSGISVWYAVTSLATSSSIDDGAGWPASGLIFMVRQFRLKHRLRPAMLSPLRVQDVTPPPHPRTSAGDRSTARWLAPAIPPPGGDLRGLAAIHRPSPRPTRQSRPRPPH